MAMPSFVACQVGPPAKRRTHMTKSKELERDQYEPHTWSTWAPRSPPPEAPSAHRPGNAPAAERRPGQGRRKPRACEGTLEPAEHCRILGVTMGRRPAPAIGHDALSGLARRQRGPVRSTPNLAEEPVFRRRHERDA